KERVGGIRVSVIGARAQGLDASNTSNASRWPPRPWPERPLVRALPWLGVFDDPVLGDGVVERVFEHVAVAAHLLLQESEGPAVGFGVDLGGELAGSVHEPAA